jgi:hypothetical protein
MDFEISEEQEELRTLDASRPLVSVELDGVKVGAERVLAREGIQIHGGIGFSWEQDLHLEQHRRRTADLLWREH